MTKVPSRFRRAAACLLPPALALILSAATDFTAEGKRWWSHIEYLASDDLQGRNTGSEGHLKAARYIAGEFERSGLKPAGSSGYFQPVKFDVKELAENQSSLALVVNGKTKTLALGDDATLALRGDIQEDTEAAAVFAGFGLKVPEKNYDDLAGLDVKGKVVVFLSGGPASIPGPLKSHYSSAGERWKYLKAAGAVGIATIQNPKAMDIPWSRSRLARLMPSMSLADPALDESKGLRVSININPERADEFFGGTGHTIAEILAAADGEKPLPRFPLAATIKVHVQLKKSQVESQNVAGLLPGTDPKLKNEYVVLTAHLDHVGVGRPINGDSIYNGAMDDASGVATLLDIAERLHHAKTKLRRSLLFVIVTGEEKGLLGSKYFATHPTVKPNQIVADLNVDMFLPLFPLRLMTVYGLDESDLGKQVRAVAEPMGIRIQGDQEPQRNIFIRSDQYNFIREGVPSLAFKVGYEKETPEEATAKQWLKERYHAPSDDIHQPVDLKAAVDFDNVIMALAEAVANADDRPHWNSDSFFRRFATHGD